MYINMILHVKPFRVEREDPTGHGGSDTESVSGNEDECTSIPGASPSTETSRDPGMSRDSSTSRSLPPHIPSTNLEGRIDLGEIVQAANSSWESLNSMVTKLPDDKRKQYLSFHSKPSSSNTLHSHLVTKAGKTWNACFQMRWLERFPWLSYSSILAGGICRYCVLFPERPDRGEPLGHSSRSGVLVLSPYKGPYSKALGKDGVLVSHDSAVMHCRAAKRVDLFLRNYMHPSERVDYRLMKSRDQLADENKHILRQIILATEFLAKQALPFRGHRDDKVDFSADKVNRGNFVATLQLMAKGDSILNKHLLSAPKNAKYTSKTIQNEVVHIYASKIRERVTKPLREGNLPYTIIADETTDRYSNGEILSVCLRFVDLSSPQHPHIKECLLSFIRLQRANAAGITCKLLEAITDPSISLDPGKICGQAYDGASVMASEISGVQARIKEVSPRAVYTHCYSHCLNLSIAASCQVQEVRNLVSTINEAHFFLSNSPKRQRMFELTVKEFLPASSHSKLPGLCKTRWVERHTCFEVFLELYEPLVIFFDAILSPHEYPQLECDDGSWNWDTETRVKAQGLKAALSSFQNIAVFVITKNVLDEAKSLSAKLQYRDQDVYKAFRRVSTVIETVKSIRTNIDTTFVSWYDEILILADTIGATESVPRKTRLQRNRNNTPSTTPQEHYKRAVAIPLLDSLLTQLNERFTGENSHQAALLCLIPSLIASSESNVQLSEELDNLMYWSADLPCPMSLSSELRRWQTLWSDESSSTSSTPNNLLLALGSCDVDSFPNVHRLLLIGCTLPITSAEAERTFSLLRRIKTFARSTMAEEHFSDLAVMAMHYGERIPVGDVLHTFVQLHPRRLFKASILED